MERKEIYRRPDENADPARWPIWVDFVFSYKGISDDILYHYQLDTDDVEDFARGIASYFDINFSSNLDPFDIVQVLADLFKMTFKDITEKIQHYLNTDDGFYNKPVLEYLKNKIKEKAKECFEEDFEWYIDEDEMKEYVDEII